MTLYWWYAFLLPGAIAILCSLSHRKEESAGKYYSVFSMPVNLSRFEFAKGIILVEKLLVSAIFLALLISISNIIAPATAVYSLLHSIAGSIGIILASVWQIPLCLYLFLCRFGTASSVWKCEAFSSSATFRPTITLINNGKNVVVPKGGRWKWVLFMRFVLNRKKRSIHRFGPSIFVYLLLGHSFLKDVCLPQIAGTERTMQIPQNHKDKLILQALTTGSLLLTLLWFAHWEGRKNYE